MAAALLGDGHAAWHLATSAEAVDRELVMRTSEWYCAPVSGELISILIRPRPVVSFGSAEVTTWCAIDIYDWAKPSRSPIFDVSLESYV